MYCSSCGAADQSGDSYCRKCGEWLTPLAAGGRKKQTPAERLKVIMIFSGINSLLALFSSITLYATYLGKPEAKWSIYVAAAACTVIAVHQAISFGFALSLIIRDKRRRSGVQAEPTGITNQLGPPAGGIIDMNGIDMNGITERTTALLPAPGAGKTPGSTGQ